MKNLKIGVKIFLGFSCVFALLLAIAVTAVSSSARTGANIDEVESYSGLQSSANELIHIINETRISAGVFYETHSAKSYSNLSKQLMYCDLRLKKLYEYIDQHPELDGFRKDINAFEALYAQWRTGLGKMGAQYDLEGELPEEALASFAALAGDMRRVNLLAHEVLSNTISNIEEVSAKKTLETKNFNYVALQIVVVISIVSLFAAVFLAVVIMRSIAKPLGNMRDVLGQIGQSGDLRIPDEIQDKLSVVAGGKDETAECTAALLVLVDRMHSIDNALAHVAGGDLTTKILLQSAQDTMGLAVEKMLQNLNQKFGTIAKSTNLVTQKAGELSAGSQLLASGSQAQSASVERLLDSVREMNQKTEKNTSLAKQAANLVDSIQANANAGTEKMNQMIQAATDISAANQSIGKVIKVIDDIAFQTNILALNAAVEAARAGQHGKGFAVVAEEVRNLANKSAEAAKETGVLIENTIQKAALGASIAEQTSESLGEIVKGVKESNTIIADIAVLSSEQASDIRQIITDVQHVEQIVNQNNTIALGSANAAGEIADQSNLLKELVAQFQLLDRATTSRHEYLVGGIHYED